MKSQVNKNLICSIFTAGQVWRERARAESNLTDCSFLHLHTLHYIWEQDTANMKEIANFLHITPPSATSVVNSLVAKGLLTRVGSESDRRAIKLQITKSGGRLLHDSFKRMTAFLEKNIDKLTETEKQNFLSILNKIS
jgi:DNA-binding MarR family transcriptional regulator